MFFSDYLRYAIKGILAKKLRFFLTVLSILIGMTSVILITTIGETGTAAVNGEMDKLGLNGVSFRSKMKVFDQEELDYIQDYLGENYDVSPINKEGTALVTEQSQEYAALVWGGGEKLSKILNMDILYGREIRKKDIESAKPIALLTRSGALKIFGKENAVGEEFTVKNTVPPLKVTIVGIVDNSQFYDMLDGEVPQFLYLPASTMQKAFRLKGYTEISVVSKTDVDLDQVCQNVISALENKKGIHRIYYYENLNSYKKSISKIADIVTLIIALIGSVALVVGGISVMNTMLVSVGERTREIGIKKAVGFTNLSILAEFLIESVIITFLACLLGLIFGLLLSFGLLQYFKFQFKINPISIRNALLLSMGMGIAFGVYPAYKASRQNPIDALK